ncbi:hypothetical protein BHM03_00003372 [Ensete ventricosum]|nr:hypothetical protein BHM03_00003372 [Ensete ventricosum]
MNTAELTAPSASTQRRLSRKHHRLLGGTTEINRRWSISTVGDRLREKEEGEEKEGETYLTRAALPRFPRTLRRLRAIPSPHAGRRNEATASLKLQAACFKEALPGRSPEPKRRPLRASAKVKPGDFVRVSSFNRTN